MVNAQTTAIEFNRKLGAILHEVAGSATFLGQAIANDPVKRGSESHWTMNGPAAGG